MKILVIIIALLLFTGCQNNQSNPMIATNTANTQIHKTVGIIKKIDNENGKIAIDHEDIKGYMPAMEMDFQVKDKSLIESSKIGDKIDFEIERNGENLIIVKLNKIGETVILSGAEIYKTNCAGCHGKQGEGTKKGISLVKGHALHHSELEHVKQVTDGEGEKMPAFRDKLSVEQITSVVKFMRTEIQKGKNREESHKHSH